MLPKPVPDDVFQLNDPQQSSKVSNEETDDVRQEDEDRPETSTMDKNVDSDDDEKGSEVDSELEALMRENSDYPSSSSSENEDDSMKTKGGMKRRSRNRSSYETPVNTIAVLVVACWMLRIPVMYQDFDMCVFSILWTRIMLED
jgi:RNA polymerase I-specific transcription initiation factor RRN7